jgi:hypothetical protein
MRSRQWKHALREHGNKVRQRIRNYMLKNFNLLFGPDTELPQSWQHHEKDAFAKKFEWFIRGGEDGTEPLLGRSDVSAPSFSHTLHTTYFIYTPRMGAMYSGRYGNLSTAAPPLPPVAPRVPLIMLSHTCFSIAVLCQMAD